VKIEPPVAVSPDRVTIWLRTATVEGVVNAAVLANLINAFFSPESAALERRVVPTNR